MKLSYSCQVKSMNYSDHLKNISDRIKFVRSKCKMTQDDFAQTYGAKTKGSVSDWENGRSTPNIYQLYEMAKSIGKDLDWLVMGDHTESVPKINDNNYSYLPGTLKLRKEAIVPAGRGEITDLTDWIQEEVFNFDYDNHIVLQIDEEFGESMKPFMHPGDYLVISFSAKISDKDPVAARWDETKGAIKIVNFLNDDPKKIVLTSFNQNVSPMILPRKKVSMYKIVAWIPNKRRT